MERSSTPSDATLLAAYGATLWRIRHPRGELPLRLGVPVHAPDLLPCAIITAWNPASEPRSAATNDAANRELLDRLLSSGASCIPAIACGHGPDARLWDEPGFLASNLTFQQAVDIAAASGQNALVWVDHDAVPVLIASRHGFAGASPGDRLPTLEPPSEHAGPQPHEERPAHRNAGRHAGGSASADA